eukprot:m.21993 g.21993  ORF g.21993 m.21993 type:complete len:75 (-) comp8787_c0_seq1:54-278(-)
MICLFNIFSSLQKHTGELIELAQDFQEELGEGKNEDGTQAGLRPKHIREAHRRMRRKNKSYPSDYTYGHTMDSF